MELLGIFAALVAVALLCGWGAFALWSRGWRTAALTTLLLVLGTAGLFGYLASVATGSYLVGLGEMLIAISLLAGPAAGIVLGILAAWSRRVGLAAGGIYACGLALLLAGIA